MIFEKGSVEPPPEGSLPEMKQRVEANMANGVLMASRKCGVICGLQ